MPAIITHYLFGQEAARSLPPELIATHEELEAFMLGNQGPDVLFFSPFALQPRKGGNIGSAMHKTDAGKLLAHMRDAANMLPDDIKGIGCAYVRGLYCHALLDALAHPFIHAQQDAIVSAGIEGLDPTDAHEVHAEIESDLDVLVLSAMGNTTIASFDPLCALEASDEVIHVISLMCKYVARSALGRDMHPDAYRAGIEGYRVALVAMRSPKGVKRAIIGAGERLFRKHSLVRAMSHRDCLIDQSIFDNHEHAPWTHPGTHEVSTDGFWDIYDRARRRALFELPLMMDGSFDMHAALGGTGLNGNPTIPQIIAVE